ncbi:LacI family DNA-binding transcriptional regulator [Endozoicomonas montiporae]|nr:LacI family DNA-binding transcriptional regulator [Endozoicomonas montiporae]
MAKTVDEIARMAGVSVTSVRLVISGQDKKYRISERTRARIQSIIDEYGYSINQTARSLKLQRTLTLGLVVPHLTNPVYSQFAEELEACCQANGYQVIAVCSDDNETVEAEMTQSLINRGVDGLFVAPPSRERQRALLEDRTKPIVFIDRDFGFPSCISTVSDGEGAGVLLGRALSGKLSSDVYVLAGDDSLPTGGSRMRGLVRQLGESGHQLADHQIRRSADCTDAAGFDLMAGVCRELNAPPKALVTLALPMLEGAMRCLKRGCGCIPDDMLIGSFDHHSMLDFLPNPAFSVRQNAGSMAEMAYKQMSSLIACTEPDQVKQVVDVELVRHF